jgi:hypothetical protein
METIVVAWRAAMMKEQELFRAQAALPTLSTLPSRDQSFLLLASFRTAGTFIAP